MRYFKEASKGSLVFAANSSLSPALCEADGHVITPLIYDEGYIPFLLDFCREHEIGLVVPLFDVDVWMLSCHKEEFEQSGILVAASSREVVAFCNDKSLMNEGLSSLGIAVPKYSLTVEGYKFGYPAFVKPRFGMGSIGIFRAESEDELSLMYSLTKRRIEESYLRFETRERSGGEKGPGVIIEEEIRGTEYGLDVIDDLSGNYVTTIVRRKLAMRSGETDEALVLTETDPEHKLLSKLGESIASLFHHTGNMDMDVIIGEQDGRPYVLDMNARFGGGYPFSHAAGVDLPAAYVDWAMGLEPSPELLKVKRRIHAYKDMDVRVYND